MAANPDHIPQIQKLEELISLFPNHVLPHVYLYASAIAGQMRKSRLAMRPQRHDPAGDADFHRLGVQLVQRARAELFGHFLRRMRPGKLARVGRVAEGFNFAQLLQSLLKLIQRFKFQ